MTCMHCKMQDGKCFINGKNFFLAGIEMFIYRTRIPYKIIEKLHNERENAIILKKRRWIAMDDIKNVCLFTGSLCHP